MPERVITLDEPLVSSTGIPDVVETFSVHGELSATCWQKGFFGNQENGPPQDLGTMVTHQTVAGLLWQAPPCQNWAHVRYLHQRCHGRGTKHCRMSGTQGKAKVLHDQNLDRHGFPEHFLQGASFLQQLAVDAQCGLAIGFGTEHRASSGTFTVDTITGAVTGGPEMTGNTVSYPSEFGESAQALLLSELFIE